MKSIFLVFSIIFLFPFLIFGQAGGVDSDFPAYSPNILPPSPDAYSFTKYGNLPIGLNTGTAQYNVPIFGIQSGSLTHNISVGYSSNGIKVDEMSTRVGLGWSLKAGGAITRRIMDKPDGAPGIQPVYYHGSLNYDTSNWNLYTYIRQAANSTPVDFQPDEYSFSMDGYSGKFIRRENGEFTLTNSGGIKIFKDNNGFVLITPNGSKYFFYLEETIYDYHYENTSLNFTPSPVPTTWNLTKVLSVTNDSILFNYLPVVEDVNNFLDYHNGISQVYGTIVNVGEGYNPTYFPVGYDGEVGPQIYACREPNPPPLQTTVERTKNRPNYISSIQFSTGKVDFLYSGREDIPGEKKLDSIKILRSSDNVVIKGFSFKYNYSYAQPNNFDTYTSPGYNYTNQHPELRKRLFLAEINKIANDGYEGEKTTFEYEDKNALPPRLSFAQDRFGSFNSKNNGLFFFPNDTWIDKHIGNNMFGADRNYNFASASKGILSRINYPTGGFTILNYEPNKTQIDYAYKLKKDSIKAVIDTSTYSGQVEYSDTFYVSNYWKELHVKGSCNWATVPISTTVGGGGHIDFEDAYKVNCALIDMNGNSVWNGDILVGGSFVSGILDRTIAPGYYRWRIEASRPSLRASIVGERWWKENDRSPNSGIAGVRVKSISDFTEIGKEYNKREFIYGNWGDTSVNNSSGTGINNSLNHGNEISSILTEGLVWPGQPNADCGYNIIHSNSVLSGYLSENNTVIYKKVIELNTVSNSNINNGGTEYEFNYENKKLSLPITFTWPTNNVNLSPKPIVPINTPYSNNDFITGTEKSSKSFKYSNLHGGREFISEKYNYYSIDTLNLKVDTFLLSRWTGIKPYYNYTYFSHYDIYRSFRYFGFLKLDSTVHRTFSSANYISESVKYQNYSNNVFKPTQIQIVNSKGKEGNILRNYIGDNSSFPSIYFDMRQKNILEPLLSEDYYDQNFSQLTHKKINFENQFSNPNLYLPSTVYSSLNGGLEVLEMNYNNYDNKGNLVQYTGKDGIINSIIWGYNQQYPVAKIQGKTFNECLAVLDMNLISNPLISDINLRLELNKLRNMSGTYFVTSYTYSPLVGVTSISDVNNRTSFYEYDNFNRLSIIRDNDGNIIKKICYNFFGEPEDCPIGCNNYTAIWQNTSTPVRCQIINGQYTGFTEQEQININPCVTVGNQWVLAGENTSQCPTVSCVPISYNMQIFESGFTAVYTSTTTSNVYTFNLTPNSSGSLGCIPPGNYNLTISKPSGYPFVLLFNCGCNSTSGTSANFYYLNISGSTCNEVNVSLDL